MDIYVGLQPGNTQNMNSKKLNPVKEYLLKIKHVRINFHANFKFQHKWCQFLCNFSYSFSNLKHTLHQHHAKNHSLYTQCLWIYIYICTYSNYVEMGSKEDYQNLKTVKEYDQIQPWDQKKNQNAEIGASCVSMNSSESSLKPSWKLEKRVCKNRVAEEEGDNWKGREKGRESAQDVYKFIGI